MLISIIVTNYNYGQYIGSCLESCLAQTYASKEIIVVDDGSTDRSRELIANYGSRIMPVYKENGGQGSAFNAGFAIARGDIVLFLDSDDLLLPACLDELARNWNSALSKIHFNLKLIGPEGEDLGETYCRAPLPQGDLSELLLTQGTYVTMPTSGNAFARPFLEKVMPIPAADWRGHADVYVMNLAPLFGCVGAIDQPLGCYRIHGGSMSSPIVNSRFRLDRCRASISREAKTDKVLAEVSARHGLNYEQGALTNAYPHLQKVLLHNKLAPVFGETRQRHPLHDFLKLSGSIRRLKGMSAFKIALIHAWMLLFLLAPLRWAEQMAVISYQKGAILSAPRRRCQPPR
jgi:glycosyltransferase involved in cell wall biosynthesis